MTNRCIHLSECNPRATFDKMSVLGQTMLQFSLLNYDLLHYKTK